MEVLAKVRGSMQIRAVVEKECDIVHDNFDESILLWMKGKAICVIWLRIPRRAFKHR